MSDSTTTRLPRAWERNVPGSSLRVPPVPRKLGETGLTPEGVLDLVLKVLYVQGARTGRVIEETVRLPFQLLDDMLLDLQQRQLVEVRGTTGHGRAGYIFDLTSAGRSRAREAMETSQYVGPAPVPLSVYSKWVEEQSVGSVHVRREEIEDGFGDLVLRRDFLEQIGPAINSAKSMFLYGDSGNGKTAIAEAIAQMIGGSMYLPYAVQAEGQTIVVHDPVYHRSLPGDHPDEADEWSLEPPSYDPRFARVTRPVVFAGGELTLVELDLQYDSHTKFYQAPFQMKANGGVLIIDDLGRQLVSPRDLLNRWIVPLEKRVDYLTLHTGHKFPVPFDCLLVFATNLDPMDLVDEAFLRRIHYKIHVSDPVYEQYERIFRASCQRRGIDFRPEAVAFVFDRFYRRLGIEPRSCHPRDIVGHVTDVAKYYDREPSLEEDLLEQACGSYFLDMPQNRVRAPSREEEQ